MTRAIALTLLAAVAFIGCAPPAEEAPIANDMPKFEGKPDPRFFGKWKAEGKDSNYDFREDGTFGHKGKVSYQGNVMENNFEGEWAVKDDLLLIKDPNGAVSDYTLEVEADTITLTSVGSMKTKTVLKRS